MIDHPGIPRRFNAFACGRHAATRLAGNDDFFDRQLRQVDVVLGRHFCHVQRVGRRAQQRGHTGISYQFNTSETAESAAGDY